MAKTSQQIALEMLLKSDEYQKDVKKAAKSTGAIADETEKASKKSGGFLRQMRVGWVALGAAVTMVARKMTQYGKESIKAAEENEVAQIKFRRVFRGSLEEAKKGVAELQQSYAMSGTEAIKMLSGVQDLLVPMGLMRSEAAGVSVEVAKLTADISAFNGKPTAEVMQAIQSAMVGMNRPMMQYGVVLSAVTVKQEAINMKLHDGTGELSAAAKAQATLSLITKASGDAAGATADQWNTWAGMMKRIKAAADDMMNVLGDELLRALKPAVKMYTEWMSQKENTDRMRVAFRRLGNFIQKAAGFVTDLVKQFMKMRDAIREIAEQITDTGARTVEELGQKRMAALRIKIAMEKKQIRELLEAEKILHSRKEADINRLEEITGLKRRFRIEAYVKRRIAAIKHLEAQLAGHQTELLRLEDEGRREREAAAEAAAEEKRERDRQRNAAATMEDFDLWLADIDKRREVKTKAREEEEAAEKKHRAKLLKVGVDYWKKVASLVKKFSKQNSDAQIDAVQRRVDAGIITEKEGDKEMRGLKRKQFAREQAFAIGEALVNGALAITNIIAKWAANPAIATALGLATAAITTAQVALISQQKVPAFAGGGIAGLHGPEMIVVGERGPEMITPSGRTQQSMNTETNNSMNFGPESVVLQVSGGEQGAYDLIEKLQEISSDSGRGSFFRG